MLLSLIVLVAWGFGNVALGFLLFQHTASLAGARLLLAGVSLAVGFGQMTAILVLPILPTVLLLAAQTMLMGFIMLRSAR